MAIRPIELREVLKSAGSLYLPCETSARQYLRLLPYGVFRVNYLRSEVIWERTRAHIRAALGPDSRYTSLLNLPNRQISCRTGSHVL
jgi:hypothetical protein